MLILTRKANETVIIGGNIRVRIANIRGGSVRLGIEAPEDIEIFREEIYPGPEERELPHGAGIHALGKQHA